MRARVPCQTSALCSIWGCHMSMRRSVAKGKRRRKERKILSVSLREILGPIVLGVTARQLFSHLRIEALPEACQVAGHLHGALIRSQQPHHQRDRAPRHGGGFPHSEEVL